MRWTLLVRLWCTDGFLHAEEVVFTHLLRQLLDGLQPAPQVGGHQAQNVLEPQGLHGSHMVCVDAAVNVVVVSLTEPHSTQ